MEMLFTNVIIIFVFIKNTFKMFPTQNILRYLPQWTNKRLVEYRLNSPLLP